MRNSKQERIGSCCALGRQLCLFRVGQRKAGLEQVAGEKVQPSQGKTLKASGGGGHVSGKMKTSWEDSFCCHLQRLLLGSTK